MLKARPCQVCRKWFHPDPTFSTTERFVGVIYG
jgi:hypothetical protein